jgi:hypothetical protein
MKRTILFLGIAAVLLVGLFFIIKPASSTPGTDKTPVLTNKVFEIVVQNRKIVSGGNTLQVNEGDNVTLNFTVDEGGEVHLHGYDKMVELQKNVPGAITFTANLTGRFPFELEASKTDLGILEVQPKQ